MTTFSRATIMAREVRNLKGEIVQEAGDDKRWYHFSATTWLLIGGLILFNVGCLFNTNIIDGIFWLFNFQHWAWWYFIVFPLIGIFVIKWCLLYMAWHDPETKDTLESEDVVAGWQFIRMSVTITFQVPIFVLLRETGVMQHMSESLELLLVLGSYNLFAMFTLLLICISAFITIYVVKEWFTTVYLPPPSS